MSLSRPQTSCARFGPWAKVAVVDSRDGHGGKVTLRLTATGPERVEYVGEVETEEATYGLRASIAVLSGEIELGPAHGGASAPAWLVEVARTTLRGAWRAYRTGTPWPRRVSRWREAPEGSAA
jgi:hypothetical protein